MDPEVKWEIWVKGMSLEGYVNKCVSKFVGTANDALKAFSYAVDSYPRCEARLQTSTGRAESAPHIKLVVQQ